jgi:hypothetical protein
MESNRAVEHRLTPMKEYLQPLILCAAALTLDAAAPPIHIGLGHLFQALTIRRLSFR